MHVQTKRCFNLICFRYRCDNGVNQYSFIDLFTHVHSDLSKKTKTDESVALGGLNDGHRRSGRPRILIVDDEEDVTFFLKEALEELGEFDVVTYNDPLVALSSFNDQDKNTDPSAYDLILLDIKMPKMDGFELYQEIQKRMDSLDTNDMTRNDQSGRGKRAKICFMTAFEIYFDALRELFPDTYASMCFIKKPSSAQDLVERISKEIS